MSSLLSLFADIRSMSKFRKLKSFALTHGASGFAKAGRPGILLYEVESKDALVKFLATVRSEFFLTLARLVVRLRNLDLGLSLTLYGIFVSQV